MKITLVFLALSIGAGSYTHAQTTLAHWNTALSYKAMAVNPTHSPDLTAPCVTALETFHTTGYSRNSMNGSEDNGDYNCFSGWQNTPDDNIYVGFSLSFDTQTSGQLTGINFDVSQYTPGLDKIDIKVFHNGSATPSFTAVDVATMSQFTWTDNTVSLGSGLTSSVGNSDVYDVRLYAYGSGFDPNDVVKDVIDIDNIRLLGSADCIPEPSGTAFLGLGVFGLLLRHHRR